MSTLIRFSLKTHRFLSILASEITQLARELFFCNNNWRAIGLLCPDQPTDTGQFKVNWHIGGGLTSERQKQLENGATYRGMFHLSHKFLHRQLLYTKAESSTIYIFNLYYLFHRVAKQCFPY